MRKDKPTNSELEKKSSRCKTGAEYKDWISQYSISPIADLQPLNGRLVLVGQILSLILALRILRPASRLLLVF